MLVTVTAGAVVRAVARRRTSPAHAAARDPLVAALRTTTAAALLVVGERGGGHAVAAGDVPVVQPRQRGVPLGQLLGGRWDEAPAAALVLDAPWVVTVSAGGLVKRTAREDVEARAGAVAVRPGTASRPRSPAAMTTTWSSRARRGLVTRFPAAEVRPTGRGALGVAGLQVPAGGQVVAASAVPATGEFALLTLGADGTAKRTPLAEYQSRAAAARASGPARHTLAWCGPVTDLHVPTASGWAVLAGASAPEARRSARGAPVVEAVTGAVVPGWPAARRDERGRGAAG